MKFWLITLFVIATIVILSVVFPANEAVSKEYMSRSIDAWSLDIKKMEYQGVVKREIGIAIERWGYTENEYSHFVDVTNVVGLVCYSKRNNVTGEITVPKGSCLQYPH